MPSNNHFSSILVSDIKLNNSLDYFYYDGMNEGGNILKYNGRLNYILENYNVYLAIYHKIYD